MGKVRNSYVPCRFCGGDDHDGHLFWECTFPPLVGIREHPEFHDLMEMDKTSCPRCLLWHMVGYPFFSVLMTVPLGLCPLLKELLIFLGVPLGGILLVSFQSGGCLLVLMLRVRLGGLQMNLMFGLMVVWLMTRCLVFLVRGHCALLFGFVGFGLAGSGVIGMMMLVMVGSVVSACRGFCSVPGPLQTVQRVELWGVILALQANDGVHLRVHKLGVVRHVGRILDGKLSSRPCELLPESDPLFLIERMLHIRGLDTVRFSKVKGHADEALVRAGTVRGLYKFGNDGADEAADLVVEGFRGGLLTLGGIFLLLAPGGVLLSLSCIVSLSPFLRLWLIMMVVLVLLLILLSGLLVVLLREDGLRCGIGLFYLGRLISGLVLGSLLLSPLFLAVILRSGLILLVCW